MREARERRALSTVALWGHQGFLKTRQEIQSAKKQGQTLNSCNIPPSLCESNSGATDAQAGRQYLGHLLQLFQMRTEVNNLAQESVRTGAWFRMYLKPSSYFHTFLGGHTHSEGATVANTLVTLLNSRLRGAHSGLGDISTQMILRNRALYFTSQTWLT